MSKPCVYLVCTADALTLPIGLSIIDPEHATEGKKAGGGVKYRRGGASTMSSYAPNQMARAASFSPDGNEVAIGLNNG